MWAREPTFGIKGKKATRCRECKDESMVDVKHPKCKCGLARPSFGVPGKKATCCVTCKNDSMQDVTHKLCKCGKRPSFGHEGKSPTCCIECKNESMVPYGTCRCGLKVASIGFPGGRRECCKKCRVPGMITINASRCQCGLHVPSFGMPGGRPECCSTCRTPEMINLNERRCECGKAQAHFGLIGEGPRCCLSCKSTNAYYAMTGNRATTCGGCREPEMVRVAAGYSCVLGACEPAKTVPFGNVACYECRNRVPLKIWERKVVEELTRLGLQWSYHDSRLPCGRAKGQKAFRPDFIFVINDFVIILEVDENEHRDYELSCEVGRIGSIKDSIELPLLLVRLNPSDGRIKMLEDTMKWAFSMEDRVKAHDAGVILAYHGYSESRRLQLHEQMVRQNGFAYETIVLRTVG